MTDKATVFEAMANVMNDVGSIGKNRRADAKMGGYAFRGIDDLYNALHDPLAKHGVFYLPEVLEEEEQTYKTSGGATMRLVRVKVRYRFYGPGGDSVEAVTIGEAADTGDKAANKAMTAALKYLLFQVFCIAVEGDEDADGAAPQLSERQTPSRQQSRPEPLASQAQVGLLQGLLKKLLDPGGAMAKDAYREAALDWIAQQLGGLKLASSKELTKAQASQLINSLQDAA